MHLYVRLACYHTVLLKLELDACLRRLPAALPSAADAVAFVEKVVNVSLAAARQQLESGGLARNMALQVRDAAMLAMCVGHVGLAMRISVIRTLKSTLFGDKACVVDGCTTRNCCGNRLEAVALPDGGGTAYQLVVPHHKTSSRGIAMPTIIIKSKKLIELLWMWEEEGRPRVSALHSHDV